MSSVEAEDELVQVRLQVQRVDRSLVGALEAFWNLDWDPYDVNRPPVA